eukprot:gene17540-20930_t
MEEVSKHCTRDDLWMVIEGKVYDCTTFVDDHPGGGEYLIQVAGTDATNDFVDIGHSEKAYAMLTDFYIGDCVDPKITSTTTTATAISAPTTTGANVEKKEKSSTSETPATTPTTSSTILFVVSAVTLVVAFVAYVAVSKRPFVLLVAVASATSRYEQEDPDHIALRKTLNLLEVDLRNKHLTENQLVRLAEAVLKHIEESPAYQKNPALTYRLQAILSKHGKLANQVEYYTEESLTVSDAYGSYKSDTAMLGGKTTLRGITNFGSLFSGLREFVSSVLCVLGCAPKNPGLPGASFSGRPMISLAGNLPQYQSGRPQEQISGLSGQATPNDPRPNNNNGQQQYPPQQPNQSQGTPKPWWKFGGNKKVEEEYWASLAQLNEEEEKGEKKMDEKEMMSPDQADSSPKGESEKVAQQEDTPAQIGHISDVRELPQGEDELSPAAMAKKAEMEMKPEAEKTTA